MQNLFELHIETCSQWRARCASGLIFLPKIDAPAFFRRTMRKDANQLF